jgi:S-adenosylmethionine-diacylglycerol 3-amino-3-carboxypropyl transferase
MPESEIAPEADWSIIRYAQCWEDADVLLEALDIHPGDVCLSIASAGDNTLSMLTNGPAKVVAIDLSPAQIACLEIRVAAYRELRYEETLELLGATPSDRRQKLYEAIRKHLRPETMEFWHGRQSAIEGGVAAAGKFENYLRIFREVVLPLIHSRRRVTALFEARSSAERRLFYEQQWDNLRWRLLFRCFFSRAVMGWLGRDPAFFHYVKGSVAERIMVRTKHALTDLDPSQNPYLQQIALGQTLHSLPHALRRENYDSIRSNLNRLEWHVMSVESYLAEVANRTIDRFNMSDVFEYVSEANYVRILEHIVRVGRPGGRVAYWNMLAPRRRPEAFSERLMPLQDLADRLHQEAKTFFYSAFVVEEIR